MKERDYSVKYKRLMYEHFSRLILNDKGEVIGIPSIVSFAREIGVSLGTVERWIREQEEFSSVFSECTERRKQLIIDAAFCKKIDPTFAKFYLSAEFGLGEKESGEKECFNVTDEDKRLIENIARRLGIYG